MTLNKFGAGYGLLTAIILLVSSTFVAAEKDLTSKAKHGALVFQTRCTLCHGNFGMGEGVMPLIIKDYPDTNLLAYSNNTDVNRLRNSVLHGGTAGQASEFSPPWVGELSYIDVESVVQFLNVFYTDNDAAISLLQQARDEVTIEPKINIGMAVYRSRCMVCHGRSGNGDGTMSTRLRIPPASLVKSRLDDTYLTNIISKGGQSVSRSFQMPPWEDTLTRSEISSVIIYIKTLRE